MSSGNTNRNFPRREPNSSETPPLNDPNEENNTPGALPSAPSAQGAFTSQTPESRTEEPSNVSAVQPPHPPPPQQPDHAPSFPSSGNSNARNSLSTPGSPLLPPSPPLSAFPPPLRPDEGEAGPPQLPITPADFQLLAVAFEAANSVKANVYSALTYLNTLEESYEAWAQCLRDPLFSIPPYEISSEERQRRNVLRSDADSWRLAAGGQHYSLRQLLRSSIMLTNEQESLNEQLRERLLEAMAIQKTRRGRGGSGPRGPQPPGNPGDVAEDPISLSHNSQSSSEDSGGQNPPSEPPHIPSNGDYPDDLSGPGADIRHNIVTSNHEQSTRSFRSEDHPISENSLATSNVPGELAHDQNQDVLSADEGAGTAAALGATTGNQQIQYNIDGEEARSAPEGADGDQDETSAILENLNEQNSSELNPNEDIAVHEDHNRSNEPNGTAAVNGVGTNGVDSSNNGTDSSRENAQSYGAGASSHSGGIENGGFWANSLNYSTGDEVEQVLLPSEVPNSDENNAEGGSADHIGGSEEIDIGQEDESPGETAEPPPGDGTNQNEANGGLEVEIIAQGRAGNYRAPTQNGERGHRVASSDSAGSEAHPQALADDVILNDDEGSLSLLG